MLILVIEKKEMIVSDVKYCSSGSLLIVMVNIHDFIIDSKRIFDYSPDSLSVSVNANEVTSLFLPFFI